MVGKKKTGFLLTAFSLLCFFVYTIGIIQKGADGISIAYNHSLIVRTEFKRWSEYENRNRASDGQRDKRLSLEESDTYDLFIEQVIKICK